MNVCLGLLVCMLLFHDFSNAEWLNRREKMRADIFDQGARCLSAFRLVGTAILVVCFVLHFVFVVSEPRCVFVSTLPTD